MIGQPDASVKAFSLLIFIVGAALVRVRVWGKQVGNEVGSSWFGET
jgi:hypothetical protein